MLFVVGSRHNDVLLSRQLITSQLPSHRFDWCHEELSRSQPLFRVHWRWSAAQHSYVLALTGKRGRPSPIVRHRAGFSSL